MLGFEKSAVRGNDKVKRVKFTRFRRTSEAKNALVGTEILGCNCRDGRLRRWLGFCEYTQDGGVQVDWTDKVVAGAYSLSFSDGTKRILLVGSDGYAYAKRDTDDWEKGFYLGRNPSYLSMRVEKEKTYHIIAGAERVQYTLDGLTFARISEGDIRGVAIAEKRLFIAYAGGRIAYSAPFEPTRFGGTSREGGELYLPADFGEVAAIAGTGPYLYAFGNNAVYRVSVKADATRFVVEPLAYTGGKIIPRSAIEGEGTVFFLAEEGSYRVKGERIERICEYLSLNPLATACTVGRVDDACLLEYREKSGGIRWVAISADGEEGGFLTSQGHLCGASYFFKDGVMQRLVRGNVFTDFDTPPYFQSGWEWLDCREQKILKRLLFRGKGRATVEIRSGEVNHRYTVSCQNGAGETLLCERGRAFIFRIIPSEDCEIESMAVEFVTT